MPNILYLNQFKTTTLSVVGGIDASQTTGIVIQSVSGLDTTKPGIACITYTDPLDLDNAEYIEYTAINSTTKTFTGVTRGAEGYSAKSHSNGVTVAFPVSESHVNRLADAVSIGADPTNPITGVLDEDTMSSDSAVKVPTQQSTKAYVDTQIAAIPTSNVGDDGWTTVSDTWTYASASTFTIAGVDRTTTYTKGTRLKFVQSSTTKYAVVVSSSFSTDTTVTIAVNTDYTIANEAITSPYYSYQANPQGYPGWFSFTPTWTGFSANPAGTTKYNVIGNKITYYFNPTTGTSNSSSFTATVPVPMSNNSSNYTGGIMIGVDGGTGKLAYATQGSTTRFDFYTSLGLAGWVASGNKTIFFCSTFELA